MVLKKSNISRLIHQSIFGWCLFLLSKYKVLKVSENPSIFKDFFSITKKKIFSKKNDTIYYLVNFVDYAIDFIFNLSLVVFWPISDTGSYDYKNWLTF
jgi:hypothetical protein